MSRAVRGLARAEEGGRSPRYEKRHELSACKGRKAPRWSDAAADAADAALDLLSAQMRESRHHCGKELVKTSSTRERWLGTIEAIASEEEAAVARAVVEHHTAASVLPGRACAGSQVVQQLARRQKGAHGCARPSSGRWGP